MTPYQFLLFLVTLSFLAVCAAVVGVHIMFRLTPGFSGQRPPLRQQLVVCLVSASLAFPAFFVTRLFVQKMNEAGGFVMLGVGMGCAAASSAIMTLAIMLKSR